MKEYPILFSGEMVQAILDGRKTQTRRVIKDQPALPYLWNKVSPNGFQMWTSNPQQGEKGNTELRLCPYGAPGDRLWVRETWRAVELDNGNDGILYKADNHFKSIENSQAAADLWCDAYADRKYGNKWRPSIFMPRWASRIALAVTDVRVERLQEISEEDAIAEGLQKEVISVGYQNDSVTLRAGPKFVYLWDKINSDRGYSFESNPWVWVISFKVV